ncbi:MAG: hypothetical protein HQL19_02460 [Candidatus Omnitrophica bacterium]|nr:hypothetical protein [Candidatus Omnitrophota bacterium]
MRSKTLILCCVLACLFFQPARAEENVFKKYNPDIDKYVFVKSFIMGLSYYDRVARRLKEEDMATVAAKADRKAIQAFIDHRTLDNTELRIAKNYIIRYGEHSNGLIRKVALDAIVVYETLLNLSVKEREMWVAFGRYKVSGQPADFNEQDFVQKQGDLALQKKEIAKDLVKASALLSKVLLSAARCDSEECKQLAITQDERDKLSKKLDLFARDNMEWGLKSGQSTVQASVAAIREVLEDPVYISK